MKILQRKLNLVLLLMVLAIFLQAPSVHAENMPQVKTPEEFYALVEEQIANGKRKATYELLFKPYLINPQEMENYASQKGGVTLQDRFRACTYTFEETDHGAILTLDAGYLVNATKDEMVQLVAKAIAKDCQGMTDYQKIKYVYDYIILNSEYNIRKNGAYNNLITGQSCCNGYAEAFFVIMKEMGIPCKYTVNTDHAWNTVYLNGAWYNIDTTWGDDGGDNISYEYFLKCNKDWMGQEPAQGTASASYEMPDGQQRAEYPNYVMNARMQIGSRYVIPAIVVVILVVIVKLLVGGRMQDKIATNEDKIRNLYKLPDE